MDLSRSSTPQNEALWMRSPRARFDIAPAPYTQPGPREIVVRARAVAVNPVDAMAGPLYRLLVPWLRYPAVIGSDVAGEVVEIGRAVTRFAVGDRVLAHLMALERSQNRPAEGAYQHYVVVMERMASTIPDTLPFEQACVLPLALSTASTGMFQDDHLGLSLPASTPASQDAVVLVWGAATSVGMNGVQLAKNAGYDVIATASSRTLSLVRELGAAEVVDRNASDAPERIIRWLGERQLAGTLAIGRGALAPCIAVAASAAGPGRVAATESGMVSRLRGSLARGRGVTVSYIWGGTLKDNEVGPAIYRDFLPAALATESFGARPEAMIVGHGLEVLPQAFRRLRAGGISAAKLVVTV